VQQGVEKVSWLVMPHDALRRQCLRYREPCTYPCLGMHDLGIQHPSLMVYFDIGVKVATLPVVALGVGIGVDYALYLPSVQLQVQRSGATLAEAYLRRAERLHAGCRSVDMVGVFDQVPGCWPSCLSEHVSGRSLEHMAFLPLLRSGVFGNPAL